MEHQPEIQQDNSKSGVTIGWVPVVCKKICFLILFSFITIPLVAAPLVTQTSSKQLMKQQQTEIQKDGGGTADVYQAEPAWNLNPDYVFGRYILPLVIALVFLISLGLLLVFVPKPNTSSEPVNRGATPKPTAHVGNQPPGKSI